MADGHWELVTGWTSRRLSHAYLVYDGNKGTVGESKTLRNLGTSQCLHFPGADVGDPILVEL
jgi:hypothetical protein